MRSSKRKAFANLFRLLNTICHLRKLRTPLRDFRNLIVVCNDTGPKQGRTKSKGFLGTSINFSCILFLLSRNVLK